MLKFLAHIKKEGKTPLLATSFSQNQGKELLEQFSLDIWRCVSQNMLIHQCHVKSSQKLKNSQCK